MFQFVTEGLDQSIKSVVEYCVVCGDKASGGIYRKKINTKNLFLTFSQKFTLMHIYLYFQLPSFRASLRSCEL